MNPKTLQKQRGAELVEFAITLPVMLIIVFIFIEFAVALCDQAVVTNASRAAAREAIRGATDAEAAAAATLVFPSLIAWSEGSSPPTVTILPDEATRSTPAVGREIQVTVSYDFDFLLLPAFLPGLTDFDLSARTVMRELAY